MVIACSSSFHFKPSQVSLLSLGCSHAKDRSRYSLTWLPIAGTREAGSVVVPMPGSIHLCQACKSCQSVHFVQSQEMAVLLKVRVCETDTLFYFFLFLFWGFFSTPFSILTPHFPWASSKNNPGAILSHQRHKEFLLPTHWLFRIQRS